MERKSYLVQYAKSLRTRLTPWEKKLWYYLRAGRLDGLKFKRQVIIENFIADFCCDEIKLLIELDGDRHRGLSEDKQRGIFLKSKGYNILRFWNKEVEKDIVGVLEKINKASKLKITSLSRQVGTSLQTWREK